MILPTFTSILLPHIALCIAMTLGFDPTIKAQAPSPRLTWCNSVEPRGSPKITINNSD